MKKSLFAVCAAIFKKNEQEVLKARYFGEANTLLRKINIALRVNDHTKAASLAKEYVAQYGELPETCVESDWEAVCNLGISESYYEVKMLMSA